MSRAYVLLSLTGTTCLAVFVGVVAQRMESSSIYIILGMIIGAVIWTPLGYVLATRVEERIASTRIPAPTTRSRRQVEWDDEPIQASQYATSVQRPTLPELQAPRRRFFMIGDGGETSDINGDLDISLT